jgi:hypothetical protein
MNPAIFASSLLYRSYLLTPWSRVLLEKLTVNFAASQEIPRIYGTRKFLTVPTSARHLSSPEEASLHGYFLTYVFYGEGLLAPRPTPKLEDHPSSAVRGCLFNLFTASLHIGGRSSIRNLRTRHAVVTGTHIHGLYRSTHLNTRSFYLSNIIYQLPPLFKCTGEFALSELYVLTASDRPYWSHTVITLYRCFSTFVRPRTVKFFFHKTRAGPVPTNLLVNTFPLF